MIAGWQVVFNSSQKRITAVSIKQNSPIENAPSFTEFTVKSSGGGVHGGKGRTTKTLPKFKQCFNLLQYPWIPSTLPLFKNAWFEVYYMYEGISSVNVTG